MLERISLMRHGEKLPGKDAEAVIHQDLEQLSEDDRKQWKDALLRLGIEDSPELRPLSLLKIREAAEHFISDLPDNSLVLFGTTLTPRTRLTADFMSVELYKQAEEKKKNIQIAFLWEGGLSSENEQSELRLSHGPIDKRGILPSVQAQMYPDLDKEKYNKTGGSHIIDDEDLFVAKLIQADLNNSAGSGIRDRVLEYEQQIKNLENLAPKETHVFYIGVGHHTSLVCLDSYFNGIREYSAEEMPQPLEMWSFDIPARS